MLDRKKSLFEIAGSMGLILFLAIIYIRPLNGYLTGFGDNATYALLAKSITQGRGYREIWTWGEPLYTQYPFVFPLLLSPLVLFVGLNFLWMKALLVFFALLSVYFVYRFYRGPMGAVWALLVGLLTGLCPHMFQFSHQITAEMPYLAFSLLAFLFMERYAKEEKWLLRSGLGVGLFIVLTYLTRKIGVVLLPVAFIYLVSRKPGRVGERLFKAAIFSLLVAVPFVLWRLRGYLATRQATSITGFFMVDPYTTHLGRASLRDIIGRIIPNLSAYSTDIASFVYMTLAYHLPHVLSLLALAGFIYAFMKRRTCAEIYVLLYIAVLSVWYARSGRYLVPLIPFIIYYFLLTVRAVFFLPGKLFRGLRAKPGKVAYVFLGIFILLMVNSSATFVRYYARVELERKTHFNAQEGAEQEFLRLCKFIKGRVPADSIILSRKPAHLYIFSGRQGVLFPYTANKEEVLQAIYQEKPDYILADDFSRETDLYLWPVIKENPHLFIPVYQARYGAVFKVLYPEKKRSPDEKGTYHRHHRTGRLLFGGVPPKGGI